ncbi:cellulose-binding domain-containing protein [Massilia sp. B-10]|nr:cellulose-binding domain-containing protein [Massilia sp. B-10]
MRWRRRSEHDQHHAGVHANQLQRGAEREHPRRSRCRPDQRQRQLQLRRDRLSGRRRDGARSRQGRARAGHAGGQRRAADRAGRHEPQLPGPAGRRARRQRQRGRGPQRRRHRPVGRRLSAGADLHAYQLERGPERDDCRRQRCRQRQRQRQLRGDGHQRLSSVTVNATETDKDVVVSSGCAVEFVTCNDWGSGQVPAITLRNTGTAPINGWSLSWTESNDVALSNSWNTTLAQSGRSFVATPVSYNQTVLKPTAASASACSSATAAPSRCRRSWSGLAVTAPSSSSKVPAPRTMSGARRLSPFLQQEFI